MPSAARQMFSPSASRLRATGKGQPCKCPKGAQATAMLCIRAQYRTRRSAQSVPQMTLETNIQRFAGGEGSPRCVKLKVALSGITDSSWVAADNHAGYARILPSLGITQPAATSRDGESSLTNAMQRRLRQVLAPIPWGVDKMAAVLASPASCG